MHDLNQKQVNDISTHDYIRQWRWRNVTHEEHEKLIAALGEAMAVLKQTIALPPVDYPPARLVQLPQPLLPLLRAEYDVYPTTSDGLPMPATVRGLAATEMLEIMTQQYRAILDKKPQTPEDDAEKRRLLAEMMTYLPLLQDIEEELSMMSSTASGLLSRSGALSMNCSKSKSNRRQRRESSALAKIALT